MLFCLRNFTEKLIHVPDFCNYGAPEKFAENSSEILLNALGLEITGPPPSSPTPRHSDSPSPFHSLPSSVPRSSPGLMSPADYECECSRYRETSLRNTVSPRTSSSSRAAECASHSGTAHTLIREFRPIPGSLHSPWVALRAALRLRPTRGARVTLIGECTRIENCLRAR